MDTSLRIALRYLISPKSHAAVNVISMISMAGIAIAAMSMVCVLSVFNGFRDLASSRLSAIDPEVRITMRGGGLIGNADLVLTVVRRIPGVAHAAKVIEQRALASSPGGDRMPVKVIGVDGGYSRISSISDLVIDGESAIDSPDGRFALISVGVAVKTGARPSVERPFYLTAPRRLGRINPALPVSAFVSDTLFVSGVYQSNQEEYDENLVYVPIESALRLFDYTTEASALDLRLDDGVDVESVMNEIGRVLGPDFIAADRLMQQEPTFRMIRIEKWITFLMLLFVLIMASFNILSTMSMLIVEKEGNMRILSSLGATDGMLRRVYLYESMAISLAGGFSGILLGAVLCLLQQHLGLITLAGDPSTLSVTSYPCRLAVNDLGLTFCVVVVIGLISGLISSREV